MIYFLHAVNGGPIKIGCSASPKVRASALSSLYPYGVEVICEFEGGRVAETFLHHCFHSLRITSEWFRSDPVLWRFALSIIDGGRPQFIPDEEVWDADRVKSEARRMFGTLERARDCLGYSPNTPPSQVFAITSVSSYSVQSRLMFHAALREGAIPEYLADFFTPSPRKEAV